MFLLPNRDVKANGNISDSSQTALGTVHIFLLPLPFFLHNNTRFLAKQADQKAGEVIRWQRNAPTLYAGLLDFYMTLNDIRNLFPSGGISIRS
jgi:hypothetical protein